MGSIVYPCEIFRMIAPAFLNLMTLFETGFAIQKDKRDSRPNVLHQFVRSVKHTQEKASSFDFFERMIASDGSLGAHHMMEDFSVRAEPLGVVQKRERVLPPTPRDCSLSPDAKDDNHNLSRRTFLPQKLKSVCRNR